ncbi:hypothetical protein ACXC7F_08525 [Bacillus cereus]|uniref:hypothetical protein n=1 Tax=Bacillus TaxID=1386 RepID=UPI0015BA03AD|nr:hypothetical protein [Bacillus cereus]MDG1630111.1 hypothetical protein [Bacillus cereus]MDG1630174.1 hypothetical protein [Bacillus cereus]MDK7407374.1 hypothetical protein [Bacillus cereus]MDK7413017.1 hypothetical protein [Bacillus cereus]QLF02867.1 hypothetical protein F3L01_18515 [Bacillus cereus]
MNNTIVEEITNGFVLLDFEIEKNPRVQDIITNMFTIHLKNKSVSELLMMMEKLFNEDIASAMFQAINSPVKTIEILREKDVKFLQFYQFLFTTYRQDFIKARAFESYGPISLLRMTEAITEESIRYHIIRADEKSFEIEISAESHLDVMDYFVKCLNVYVDKKEMEKDQLESLLLDMKTFKETLSNLEETLDKKFKLEKVEVEDESK